MFEKIKNKRILITGAAGCVGTNLIQKLLDINCKYITGTVHEKQPFIDNKKVTYIKGDLTCKEFCNYATKDIDYVVMCAANTHGAAYIETNPLGLVTSNVVMNTLMLDASYENNIEKFMFISSNAVYPYVDYPVKEEDMMKGDVFDKYYGVAWMKRFGEILCKVYSTKIEKKMTTIVIRPGNIYGPHDDFCLETSHVIPALIKKIVDHDDPLEIWGDGNDIRDFIYIDDFINGLLLSLENIDHFDCLNIASGAKATIKYIINILLKIESYEDANIIYNSNKPSMIPKRLIDVSKAQKILKFNAVISLEKGLLKTVEWYRKHFAK